jgi:hypothetical protein
VFNSSYGRSQGVTEATVRGWVSGGELEYHGYTMGGILGVPHDAAGTIRSDSDKTHTLTHARFALRAMHGLEDVLVVDYDEYLYCKGGKASASSQRLHLQTLFRSMRSDGLEQVRIGRQYVKPVTTSPSQCVIGYASSGNRSIFECFSSVKERVPQQFVKSMHFGYHCPLTNYHEACGNREKPRYYDCLCSTNDDPVTTCELVHLSLRDHDLELLSVIMNEV